MPTLTHLDASLFADPLRQAIEGAPLPPLGAGRVVSKLQMLLEDRVLKGELFSSLAAKDRPIFEAALWLLAGDLDRSHEISQVVSSRAGSFWHGVMHRREGDFGNAKYWFQRVGEHAAYNELGKAVAADPLASPLLANRSAGEVWDPFQFVDQCAKATRSGGELEQQCLQAQWLEWQVMLAADLLWC